MERTSLSVSALATYTNVHMADYSVRYQMDYITDRDNPGRAAERLVVAYQGAEGGYT